MICDEEREELPREAIKLQERSVVSQEEASHSRSNPEVVWAADLRGACSSVAEVIPGCDKRDRGRITIEECKLRKRASFRMINCPLKLLGNWMRTQADKASSFDCSLKAAWFWCLRWGIRRVLWLICVKKLEMLCEALLEFVVLLLMVCCRLWRGATRGVVLELVRERCRSDWCCSWRWNNWVWCSWCWLSSLNRWW